MAIDAQLIDALAMAPNDRIYNDVMRQVLAGIDSDITTLTGTVGTVTADVTALQGDVSTLQTDVATLQSDVAALLLPSGAAPGTYGNATNVAQVTVDALGRVTDVTDVSIALAIADIAGLAAVLAGKSDTGHGHAIGDITGLIAALDGKADDGHQHAAGDIVSGTLDAARLPNDGVSDAILRNSAALSVIGRAANSVGDPADISAGTDGHVLRRSGTTLGFGTVATAGLTNSAVTYAKIQNISATARLLGRITAGAGVAEELTGAQVTSLLSAATNAALGVVEKATSAEVFAATADKYISADLIESASAGVALTDAATVALDWDAGIFRTLTVTANRAIGNPTNGQPGTWRVVLVQANDATARTLTFGANFLGELPTITDCTNARWYLLMIFCVTTSHFVVSAKRANG